MNKALVLVAILIVPVLASSFSFPTVHAQANPTDNKSSPPVGAPSLTALSSSGNQLALLVEQSSQFKNLAGGKTFSVDPYSSFGYTWGPGIVPTVRIIFFSPDRVSYIVSEVANSTRSIQQIYLVNNTPEMVFGATANWGGYSAQDCSGSAFGWCYSAWALWKAYGDIQFPNSLSLPQGANNACCAFAEWTGAGQNNQGNNMVQGGVAWAGMNLPTLPSANANGYSLWTENLYGGVHPAVYFTPPGWMGGVAGQVITETTYDYTACSFNPIKDQWAQAWTVGGSSTLQYIACLPHNSQTWAYYIFEAPASSACAAGYAGQYCQLPHFSSNNCANCVSFTGIICDQNGPGTCINLNTNANPLVSSYIQHNTQDTTTSNIAPNGNQWFETWISSA